jgi:hypothetical protein
MKALRWWVLVAAALITNANLQAQSPTPAPPMAGGPAYRGEAPLMIDGPGYAEGGVMPQGSGSQNMAYGDYCGPGYCGDGYCCDGHTGNLCNALSDWFHTGRLFSCCGRGYVVAEALMLNRSDARSDLPVAAVLGGPVVMSANDPYFGYETLPRVTAGYVLHNDTAVEATYYYKDDFDANKDAISPLPIFVIPNVPVGPFAHIHLNHATAFQSGELNLVETGRTFNFIAGFRWLEIQDYFRIQATGVGGAAPVFNLDVETYNRLLGGQFGVRTACDWDLFHFEFQGKAGMFYNDATSNLQANGTQLNAPVEISSEGECESFVGELNCMMSYRPCASVALRAGYQVIWICNVALGDRQIDATNPLASGVILNDRGDLTFHGPSAGIDVRF